MTVMDGLMIGYILGHIVGIILTIIVSSKKYTYQKNYKRANVNKCIGITARLPSSKDRSEF